MTRIKQTFKPGRDFPRFFDGDVVIVLADANREYSYQLHSSVLERASPWFRNMDRLEMEEVEPDPFLAANHPLARKLIARYELDSGTEMSIPELRRSVSLVHDGAKGNSSRDILSDCFVIFPLCC